jgi:hypothetical protein
MLKILLWHETRSDICSVGSSGKMVAALYKICCFIELRLSAHIGVQTSRLLTCK